jgi:hypothetical protein
MFNKRIHGNICPYCHLVVGGGDEVEIGSVTKLDEVEAKLLFEEIDPTCGWLTCIAGPRQGQSYVIHSGKNFIGRADDMDIRLLGDDSVARRNHAIVAYDALNRNFMLLPGDSNELVYLDGKAVFTPTLMYDTAIIQLGRVKLLFRPLCGDHFSWYTETETNEIQE